MSGLFNFIKSLFSGIFGFIGGLFGGKKESTEAAPKPVKKSNGFFLELDEAASASASQPATEVEAASTEQPVTVSQEALAETAQPEIASAKKSTRKEKLAALAAGDKPASNSNAASAAAPQPALVVAAVATAEPETTFATKYLIPANNGGRRRPGANMSSYLDMARKMNVNVG